MTPVVAGSHFMIMGGHSQDEGKAMMGKRRDQKEQYPCDIAECRIPEP